MAGKYQRYPKYKDSGVEWLGEIPEHWCRLPLKHATKIRYGIGEPPSYEVQGTPLIRATNIRSGTISEVNLVCVNPANIPVNRVVWLAEGDIIVVRSGATTGDSSIIPAKYDGCIAGFDMVVTPTNCLSGFLGYTLLSSYMREGQLDIVKTRAAQPHLNAEELGCCTLIAPPLPEQRQVADFLDHETTKIDTLIEKQQQLIALLKEKRQAVISHAVTKGLNPEAPMKNSGVEWLGEVPAHWNVSKIRYVAKLESGHTPSRKEEGYWKDCSIPWITLSDVWQLRSGRNMYIEETSEKVSEVGLDNSSARLLPKGTVVLSRTASVGFSGIMSTAMATTQDFANWVCDGGSLLSEYLYYVLQAMSSEFERLKYGSTHNTIYMPDIKELKCCVPPVEEQRKAVKYIQTRIGSIDKAVDTADKAIVLLQERRTALIFAAVTGKIDVRNWQPPTDKDIQ